MDKTIIKKFGPGILIVIAIILIISTFLKSDSSAIVGKWQFEEDDHDSYVVEFYRKGTGVSYVISGGEVEDSQTFSYIVHDGMITVTGYDGFTSPYEISGNKLLLDGLELYRKGGGIIPWVRYILVIACLIFAILISKKDVVTIAEKIKKEDPEVETIGKTSIVSREKKAETATKESDDPKKDDVKIKSETEVSPTKVHSELGTTFRAKMDDVNEKEGSKETKGDWFKSAGDL
ncbi:MAG: hypothetical protein IKA17_04960 [Clostridia bacterium]|nr:hypothetical protein [Clostridia bacterium]